MNKTIALLILGVILLAMGLIMVNQYVNQPADSTPTAQAPAPKADSPQATSPEDAINLLQQRAANSELAPKTTPKPVMPAWASNAPQQPKAEPSSAPTRVEAPQTVAEKTAPKAEPVKSEPAKPETKAEAKTEAPKTTPMKVEQKAEIPKAKKETPKTEAPKPKAKPKGPKTVKRISVSNMDDAVNIRVEASEELEYKTMHLKGPDRLVVDLEGQWAIKAPGVPNNKYVSNVRIGKQGDKTRIVIDLRQSPASVRYLKRGNDGFDIRIK